MGRNSRRDPQVVDTVILQQATDQYKLVNRDGTIAGADADAFGVAMSSGDAGDPVAVCRLGFCPAIVTLAADNAAIGTELAVGANGELVAVRTAGGGTTFVVARSEDITSADGAQTGVWVDCLSLNREEEVAA